MINSQIKIINRWAHCPMDMRYSLISRLLSGLNHHIGTIGVVYTLCSIIWHSPHSRYILWWYLILLYDHRDYNLLYHLIQHPYFNIVPRLDSDTLMMSMVMPMMSTMMTV